MTSLMFRAAVGVVNTAARAANAVLTVMYPPDIGHIWDDSPREGVEAAPTEPHPVGVDDPAGGHVPPAPPAGSLTWQGWAVPAVLDVLGEHYPIRLTGDQFPRYRCSCDLMGFDHIGDWAEHTAPEIADRIGCDPNRAVLALTSLQTQ